MDNKEMEKKELNLNEMEKVAGDVENGPGHKDDKPGLIGLIVGLFKKLF